MPDVGPGGTPKSASLGLGRGLNAVFCLVSGASCVGKCVAGVKQVWQCSVVLAVWRRYELRLLKLLELFSFADTFADFNAVEQRQHGQQGRVKRPNVHSSGKLNVSLQVIFPLCSAIRRAGRQAEPWPRRLRCFIVACFPILQGLRLGRASSLALAEVPGVFICRLFAYSAVPYSGGRANSLALARQSYCSLPPCVSTALPQAGLGVSLGLG